jgi:hypothetical protein
MAAQDLFTIGVTTMSICKAMCIIGIATSAAACGGGDAETADTSSDSVSIDGTTFEDQDVESDAVAAPPDVAPRSVERLATADNALRDVTDDGAQSSDPQGFGRKLRHVIGKIFRWVWRHGRLVCVSG